MKLDGIFEGFFNLAKELRKTVINTETEVEDPSFAFFCLAPPAY